MRRVLEALERRVGELDAAPLFRFVSDASIDPRRRLSYAPCLSHFVMTFADLYAHVFREEPARDELQEIVNAHTREDGGHWKWYLADLPRLGLDPTLPFSETLRAVWSDDSLRLRKLSYGICRLALGATSLEKLVLVMCIEAAGKTSLQHVARAAQAFTNETGKALLYFGSHHVDTEAGHTLEQDDVLEAVRAMHLAPDVALDLCALVDRSFDLFLGFTEDLLAFALRAAGAEVAA